MRVFLDANILFSAAKSPGALRHFLKGLHDRSHTLIADSYVVGEAERNLAAKFPSALDDFSLIIGTVEVAARASRPLSAEIAPDLPEKDRPVLAAAIHHRCDILLTGDKAHFGPYYGKSIQGVEIHSPASLYKKLT